MAIYFWNAGVNYPYREDEISGSTDGMLWVDAVNRVEAELLLSRMAKDGEYPAPLKENNYKYTVLSCAFCSYNFRFKVLKRGENQAKCPHCNALSTKFLHGNPRGWGVQLLKKKKKTNGKMPIPEGAAGNFAVYEMPVRINFDPGVARAAQPVNNQWQAAVEEHQDEVAANKIPVLTGRDKLLYDNAKARVGQQVTMVGVNDTARMAALNLIAYRRIGNMGNAWVYI